MTYAARTVFLDTNCMVAALCTWHTHHSQAAAEIERRLRSRGRLATAAHALAEAYSVMTRLPAPHRLSPADALALLEANFMERTRLVALDASGYRSLLRGAAAEGVAGGRTYDAIIAACALKARAAVLLTFNQGHFSELVAAGVQVITPAAGRP
jgi:predicted nucleic acid-binding protein